MVVMVMVRAWNSCTSLACAANPCNKGQAVRTKDEWTHAPTSIHPSTVDFSLYTCPTSLYCGLFVGKPRSLKRSRDGEMDGVGLASTKIICTHLSICLCVGGTEWPGESQRRRQQRLLPYPYLSPIPSQSTAP